MKGMSMKLRGVSLAVAFFVFLVPSCTSAQSSDTVIGFEDLSQDEIVVSQYSSLGIVFGPNGFLPHAVKVGAGIAQSGSTVVSISCGPHCNQEFPIPWATGTFVGIRRNRVSMYVGAFAGAGAPAQLTLTARDDFGILVGQASVMVTPGAGFHTLLSVKSQQPDIASFEISARPNLDVGAQVGFDDLSFDNPAGAGAADFGLYSTSSTFEVVAGGGPTDIPVTIFRVGGSSGNIVFDIPSLQPGLQATFLPNRSAGNNITVRLTAAPATPTIFYTITIRGTPGTPSAGQYVHGLTLTILVVPGLQIFGPSVVDLSGCKNSGGPEGVYVVPLQVIHDFRVAGPVALQITGVPSGVTANMSPSNLTFPGGARGQGVTLTLAAVAGVTVPDTPIQLEATNGVVDTKFVIFVHGTCPRHNKDFVIQGTFFCESAFGVVKPIAHAQVEFFRWRSDWFDDWVGATITNDDGSFRQDLWASIEGDYYARLRLDDKEGVHLNDNWTPSMWSIDSQHESNKQPLIDLGNILISRDNGWGTPKCAVWQAGRTAYQEYKTTIGSLPPDADYSLVVWKGALTPWSSLATTNWADDYPTGLPGWVPNGDVFHDDMTNIHEFGHTIRHSVDGDVSHWINDAAQYNYARTHNFCDVTNNGFAFNEGWAEYWSKEPQFAGGCPGSGMGIEGLVAGDLAFLEQCTGVGRKGMFAVLQQGQNIVHSDLDFRNRFRQRFPNIDLTACKNPVVTQQAGLAWSPASSIPSRGFLERAKTSLFAIWHRTKPVTTQSQIASLKADITAQTEVTKQLNAELRTALKIAADPGTCPAVSCQLVAQRVVKPAILRGEVELSKQLERQWESDLASTERGERSKPLFSTDSLRLVNALKFEQERTEIVTRALRDGIAALGPLAAQDKTGALSAQRGELERQVKVLMLHPVSDEIALTFLKLPRSGREDQLRTRPSHPIIGFLAKDSVLFIATVLLLIFLVTSCLFAWRRLAFRSRRES